MMRSTSRYLVLAVLGAVGCVVAAIFFLSRGGADLTRSEEARLEERRGEFDAAMDAHRAKRMSLAKERAALNERMKAMVDATRESLGALASDEEIKKKLEENPEWKSLYKRAEDLGTALVDARGERMKVLRQYKDVASPRHSGN